MKNKDIVKNIKVSEEVWTYLQNYRILHHCKTMNECVINLINYPTKQFVTFSKKHKD